MIGRLLRLGVLGYAMKTAYEQFSRKGADPAKITKHLEVVGSDGQHVGTVDHLALKLTKNDPSAGGQHHILPLEAVAGIADGKVRLNITADEARQKQKAVNA